MRDWRLNECNDIYFADGDMDFVEDREEVLQAVAVRLRLVQGEWAYDFTLGVPWMTGMFDIRVPLILKENYLRKTIRETPGVLALLELNFNQDRENRGALVTFKAQTIYGPVEGTIS